jgi:hypothetical protein
MKDRPPPEVCPACGEDVPRKAKACPECGACYESGWNEEEAVYDGTDITEHGYRDEEEFDYDEWRAREEGRARLPGELHPMWKIAAIALVAALVIFLVLRR